jgi:hypothetical protein
MGIQQSRMMLPNTDKQHTDVCIIGTRSFLKCEDRQSHLWRQIVRVRPVYVSSTNLSTPNALREAMLAVALTKFW